MSNGLTLGGWAIVWSSKNRHIYVLPQYNLSWLSWWWHVKKQRLRNLLLNIKLWSHPMPNITVHSDSEATISKIYTNIYNEDLYYLATDYLNLVVNEIIVYVSVRTTNNR